MTKLQFHREKNDFMDWLMLNEMTTGEIALYHTLLNLGNRLGQERVFNAPASTLTKLTGLSKQGLYNARNKLVKLGVIRYQKGSSNKAPVYELVPLRETLKVYVYSNLKQDASTFTSNNLTRNLTSDLTIHKEKEKREKRRGGSSRNLSFLVKMYEENLHPLTPLLAEALKEWVEKVGVEIVQKAIELTVKKGGRTFSYVDTILKEWEKQGLTTLDMARFGSI